MNVTFVRFLTDRALYFSAFCHCDRVKGQSEALQIDLAFLDKFLNECSKSIQDLTKLSDGTENKLGVIIYDRWRCIINKIQEVIVKNGFEACFYCDLNKVETSQDKSLKDDLEFLMAFETYFNELRYVLDHHRVALKKSLRLDQSNLLCVFLVIK